MTVTPRVVVDALIEELAAIVASLTGASPTSSDGDTVPADGAWVVRVSVGGPLTGTCTLAFDASGVDALTTLCAGGEALPPDERETLLRDTVQQAVGTVGRRAEFAGLVLGVADRAVGAGLPDGEATRMCRLDAEGLASPLSISAWEALAVVKTDPVPTVAAHAPVTDSRIDVILDIELPVVIRFGRTEMPLRALTRLGPGSVVDLGRSPDDPVEMLVSGRVVARGEVVVVDGNYGLRILDVVGPSERMHSVEA